MKKHRNSNSIGVSSRPKKKSVPRRSFLKSNTISLSGNHPSVACFDAYSKAEKFIRHRSNQFSQSMSKPDRHDSAVSLMQEFQDMSPTTKTAFKASFYPNTHLTSNLSSQISLINAYYSLGKNSADKTRRPRTSCPRQKRKYSDKTVLGCQYSGFVTKLDVETLKASKTSKCEVAKPKRYTRSRRGRRSVDSVFISELDTSSKYFPTRKSLGSSLRRQKTLQNEPFADLITVAPISLVNRPKTSIN